MSEERLSNATRLDLEAADWVQQRRLWNWTELSQAEFDKWLSLSDAHRVAYLRQNAVWDAAGRLSALRAPMRQTTSANPSKRWTVLKAAAVVAVATALGWSGYLFTRSPKELTYATPVGGHETISLNDGTRIELNTNTAVRIAIGLERHVSVLHGEAYFDVRHDASRPFAVTASGYRITDLGTKFVVSSAPGHLKVSLLEGSAVVAPLEPGQSPREALMKPGDVVVADAKSLSLRAKPISALADALGWRQGVLIFKDVALADAAAEFNRYNSVPIKIDGESVGALKINGTFQANNAEAFAQSVQELFGLKLNRSAGQTKLTR